MEVQDTRENILRVAKDVFFKKGLSGARMQEIADLAGINKAMLHYYFTSKEQLFNVVFENAFQIFAGHIIHLLNGDGSLEKKIDLYIDYTIDSLKKSPGITVFVINELNTNPERITGMFAGEGLIDLSLFKRQVQEQYGEEIDAEMLFLDMVSLCIYPFIAQPIFKRLMKIDEAAFEALMNQRKGWLKKRLLNNL